MIRPIDTHLFYVYLIYRESKKGKRTFYTGYTNNPKRRWTEHSTGKTRANRGYNLIGMTVIFEFETQQEAMAKELVVKKWNHKRKKVWWLGSAILKYP